MPEDAIRLRVLFVAIGEPSHDAPWRPSCGEVLLDRLQVNCPFIGVLVVEVIELSGLVAR